jgi:hypothetical protein
MQAASVQTSSQPISQEDLQIPLGRSPDPTRIAASCLVVTSTRKIDSSFKVENATFLPNATELIWELNLFFLYTHCSN